MASFDQIDLKERTHSTWLNVIKALIAFTNDEYHLVLRDSKAVQVLTSYMSLQPSGMKTYQTTQLQYKVE